MDRRMRNVMVVLTLCVSVAGIAWALERRILSQGHNYPSAPVVITRSDVTLIAPSSTPAKLVVTDRTTSREETYYLTRDEAGYRLQGKIACRNDSAKTVEAVQLTIVLFDGSYRPVQTFVQQEVSSRQRLVTLLPTRAEREFAWEQPLDLTTGSAARFVEVAVIVTRVRFVDSSVWLAPRDELVSVF